MSKNRLVVDLKGIADSFEKEQDALFKVKARDRQKRGVMVAVRTKAVEKAFKTKGEL